MKAASLALGLSSCPNDTFMFHGLVSGRVEVEQTRFEPVMADIEALNQRALGLGDEMMDVTKLSAFALGEALGRYVVLSSGAALGRGVGPLVVTGAEHQAQSLEDLAGARVAIPGASTTAFLLLRIFGPPTFQPVPMRFDRIMPAVQRGECDAGLVIHEGRFTYPALGLRLLADLGTLWETDTGGPLPLGVIVGRADLGAERLAAVAGGLRRSIELARTDPAASHDYVRAHAQEMSEQVCRQHIELYVNDYSVELGSVGEAAIETLLARGRAAGLLPKRDAPVFVSDLE